MIEATADLKTDDITIRGCDSTHVLLEVNGIAMAKKCMVTDQGLVGERRGKESGSGQQQAVGGAPSRACEQEALTLGDWGASSSMRSGDHPVRRTDRTLSDGRMHTMARSTATIHNGGDMRRRKARRHTRSI